MAITEQVQPQGAIAQLSVRSFGLTDRGRVRDTNEDQFLVAELTKAMHIWQTSLAGPKLQLGDERAHLFLIADGMGGHNAGEQASTLAVEAIEHFTVNHLKWFLHTDGGDLQRTLTAFQGALRQADSDVLDEAAEHPDHPWLVAVQWHPEMTAADDPVQQRIFDALVQAAREQKRR